MQHKYSKEGGSRFPDSIMELGNYKDIDESVSDLITKIYQAQENDDYETAKKLITEHESLLKPYMINSELLNRLSEELYNTQIYAFTNLQQIFVSDEEPFVKMRKQDFWEQDWITEEITYD